ncbi:hypothetical protein E0H22_12300 [Rhodopseudomonas boonkerdii]|uniref:hypothetical protein n=1 Tax=Rhodopseudomonas boonkerdii TaxID=475937 RepID=UPI001E2C9579|nr:hypothetical protein [Rhodopseudomonas boonkerdii]UGV26402.1 hypothetical protein E0H22_12300 [Rhodopseudomonas boonkerdii]
MAGADIDVVIRQTAKQQNKTILAAIKARRDHFAGLAAKAKDAGTRERYKQAARDVMEQGTAAARRLQMSADNAADSFARSMRMATEAFTARAVAESAKAASEKPAVAKASKPAKKAAKGKKAAAPNAKKKKKS